MEIAQIDVFQGEQIIEHLFNFNVSQALNDHFENKGIEKMNFVENSGSVIYPILIVMIVKTITLKFVHFITLILRKYKCCRKLGSSIYDG